MPLTGELSDLSLAELIEFFCNKRKFGRLTVVYPEGASHFYVKAGAVVHASFGSLRGTEAVHYALSLPNASFTFSPAQEAPEQSIDVHWTSVVLEGLRQIDEEGRNTNLAPKITPAVESVSSTSETNQTSNDTEEHDVHAFGVLLSQYDRQTVFAPRRWSTASVIGSVVLVLAGVGVPWGWYTHNKAVRMNQAEATEKQAPTQTSSNEPLTAATPGPEHRSSTDAENSKELAKKPAPSKKPDRVKS